MNDPNQVDRDLAALRNLSARDVPELDDTIQAIRRRRLETARAPWYSRRNVMALLQSIRTRPAVAAAFAGGAFFISFSGLAGAFGGEGGAGASAFFFISATAAWASFLASAFFSPTLLRIC